MTDRSVPSAGEIWVGPLRFRRSPGIGELSLAKAGGTYGRLLAKLAKVALLIINDFGLGTITASQRHDLLEVMEDRYSLRATVVTSQLPMSQWHIWIGDPTLADALLGRLVHNAYNVSLKGGSRRKQRTDDNAPASPAPFRLRDLTVLDGAISAFTFS